VAAGTGADTSGATTGIGDSGLGWAGTRALLSVASIIGADAVVRGVGGVDSDSPTATGISSAAGWRGLRTSAGGVAAVVFVSMGVGVGVSALAFGGLIPRGASIRIGASHRKNAGIAGLACSGTRELTDVSGCSFGLGGSTDSLAFIPVDCTCTGGVSIGAVSAPDDVFRNSGIRSVETDGTKLDVTSTGLETASAKTELSRGASRSDGSKAVLLGVSRLPRPHVAGPMEGVSNSVAGRVGGAPTAGLAGEAVRAPAATILSR
jgi:hypothetical protein